MPRALERARSRPRVARVARTMRALAGVALLVGVASCRAASAPPAEPRPLVVIGVDGLEWRLALDLMKAGRLPNLAQLVADGTAGRLKTLAPALSPPIWTSMATGVVPERHGILAFVQPGVRDAHGQPLLFTSRERRVKSLWNIAEDAGLRACVIGYWMTFPVEEVRGAMIAQTGAPPGDGAGPHRKGTLQAGVSGQVHPPDYAARAFELAAASRGRIADREKDLFGDTSSWPPAMKRLARHSRWSLEADSAYQAIALDLVSTPGRCDLAIVYLGLPDVLGHRFWRWTYPGDFTAPPGEAEVAQFGDVLRRAYVQVDAFVGEMRRAAGARAGIVVASDHGMGAFRPKSDVNLSADDGQLVRTGGHSAARDAFVAAAGAGIARRSTRDATDPAGVPLVGSVLDVTPTLLALLGLPRGADMDGTLMAPLVDAAFLAAHPAREVPTHTPDGWANTRRLAAGPDPDSTKRLEQLRGLGYLD